MGLFKSKEEKQKIKEAKSLEKIVKIERTKILARRVIQRDIVNLDRTNYLGINKLAKTYEDESYLPGVDKQVYQDRAAKIYVKSIEVGSLDAEPYIFLSKYHRETSPNKANAFEKNGLDFLVLNGEKNIETIKKSKKYTTEDLVDLYAKLAYFVEINFERTKISKYKEKLILLLGGDGSYDSSVMLGKRMYGT